jgi:hypothetical protein
LAEVAKLTIMIEEEMPVRKKSITKYHRDSNNEEAKDFDENKKETKEEKNKRSF